MAKHLHLFDTEADFSAAYKGEGYVEPWVSYTEDVARVKYNKYINPNGHEYVDLGLPSGTLWATMNIGANTVTGYGDTFAWGETTPKTTYSWDNYKYGNADNALTKYCNDSAYGKDGFTDDKTVLDLEDDAARVNWGGSWRIPTQTQCGELIANTTCVWVTGYQGSGVDGCLFTSKTNGSTMFVPAAGSYGIAINVYVDVWSSSLGFRRPIMAQEIYASRSVDGDVRESSRMVGMRVRGVINPNE